MTVGGTDYDRSGHSDWYDLGASIVYSYASPLSVDAGKRYFKTSVDASPLTVSGATTVTGTYKTQYQVTFKQSGSGVAPKVTYSIDGGSDIVGTVEFSVWVDKDSSIAYTYESPVAGAAGTQYVLTSTSPGSPQTITAALEVTGTYTVRVWITRSQGFWATHRAYTWSVWTTETIGSKVINSQAKLFGAFWSDIAKTTNGTKRTSLDQARMQLLQQLVAAMLNIKAFNSAGTGASLIAAGKAAFAGTDRTAILISANLLAAFNNSGDSRPLPPGVTPGPADPKGAQAIADRPFWNSLP
jgi:hypothetical protein